MINISSPVEEHSSFIGQQKEWKRKSKLNVISTIMGHDSVNLVARKISKY